MANRSSKSDDLVLLSGATGFIGFKVLLELLSSPYNHVRLAVRDPNRAQSLFTNPALSTLLANPSLQTKSPPPAPTFATVPDITAKGAYNEAIKGVTHVIHVASPLPVHNPGGHLTAKESFIDPAKRGSLEILEAAKSAGTVQRVIITTSVVALVPTRVWRGFEISDEQYSPAKLNQFWDEPYEEETEAYAASKTAQQIAIEQWVAENKPKFDVITMHPSWVFGRADVATTIEELWKGTNRLVLKCVVSAEPSGPERRLTGAVVSVGDVARAHVKALDLEKQDGVRRFALSTPGSFEDIPGLVEKHFPDAVKEGILTAEGKQKTAPLKYDGSDTEKALGFKYETMEDIVKALLGQFVELTRQEKPN